MLSFKKVFPRAAANVIGMVHALPMPATPLYEGAKGVEAIVERATAEAKLYSGTNNLWMNFFEWVYLQSLVSLYTQNGLYIAF